MQLLTSTRQVLSVQMIKIMTPKMDLSIHKSTFFWSMCTPMTCPKARLNDQPQVARQLGSVWIPVLFGGLSTGIRTTNLSYLGFSAWA